MITLTSDTSGVAALLQRALRLDGQVPARLRELPHSDTPSVDVFVTTPFEVVAARRCGGTAQPDGLVVSGRALAEKILAATPGMPVSLSAGGAALWPGALPPVGGYEVKDVVPAATFRSLADQGQGAARDAGARVGVPTSLLDQQVLDVEGVGVDMRTVFALSQLGLVPGEDADPALQRVRVSVSGSWVRLDAAFGTVYRQVGRLSVLPLR